jgi:hypothetical protein
VLEDSAAIFPVMPWERITDEDLERYHLGMVREDGELPSLEEHLLACPECVKRAEKSAEYVNGMRAAIVEGNFDREEG